MILRVVADPCDPAFERIVRLYETSFVPDERVDSGAIGARLSDGSRFELLEALDDGRFVGFAMLDAFELRPGRLIGLILYFAVLPELRGRGLGKAIYGLILERFSQAAAGEGLKLEGLLYEVERPELADDEADRTVREKRIEFYCHLGARPLEEIDYVQPSLGQGKKPVRLHLFYHPAEPAPHRGLHHSSSLSAPDHDAVCTAAQEDLADVELHREFMRRVWGVEV